MEGAATSGDTSGPSATRIACRRIGSGDIVVRGLVKWRDTPPGAEQAFTGQRRPRGSSVDLDWVRPAIPLAAGVEPDPGSLNVHPSPKPAEAF